MSQILSGNLLVSTPLLDQTPLARSVCLVLDHGAEKVVAAVVNRPLAVAGNRIETTQTLPSGLHFGGPNASPVLALHNCRDLAEVAASDGVFVSTQRHNVEQLAENDSHCCRLILGNVQWTVEEMREQLAAGYWAVMPVNEEIIHSPDDKMWEVLLRRAAALRMAHMVGAKYIPPHPAMN